MALRDSMRNSSAQFLQPGETIQEVFGAQTQSPWMIPLVGTIITLFINRYRIFAVTDQRILVLDAGKLSMKRARGVVTQLPRPTPLGPASGLWHTIQTDAGKLWVHRRFFKDISAADAAVTPTAY